LVVAMLVMSALASVKPAGVTKLKVRVKVQGPAAPPQVTASSPNVPLGPVIVMNWAA
jgi:hypothetical protein